VVGVPDARWGEAGVAFVVANETVSEEELLDHCRVRLAKFKVPRRVRFVDALPMSGMNKVLKDDLRALETQEVPA
jgi:acyl-CoA synthetase (AMP-forming)/AMP-acid ligase II